MNTKLDYIDIASQIYQRLEMEYGWATPKDQDKAELWKFLASQLSRHDDMVVLSWNDALDKISDEGSEFPPKIPKLLMMMRRCARLRTERSDEIAKYLQHKQNV
tara:strand:- start:87 stop:398 length:312 start_codon:yes stop_codon:yes gene_type:complete